LYQGAIIGAQRLAVSSGISIVMVTVGNIGAVGVLAYISPTIEAFFIWQAVVGLIYAIVVRKAAWLVVGSGSSRKFDVVALKRVWRFSAGMGVITLSSIVFSQMDKVILSKMLTLEEFGHYMLAAVVVSGIYLLVTPVFNIIYPKFSVLVEDQDYVKLTELYRLGTRLMASILFPLGMFVSLFSKELVAFWLGDEFIAESVGPIIAFLTIGSVLHGVMYFPYALLLSYGQTRLALMNSMILMIVFLPLVVYFSFNYGALGGALAWFFLHIIYWFLGSWLTHRTLLKKIGFKWLLVDVGVPLMLSIAIGLLGLSVVHSGEYPFFVKMMSGFVMALIVFIFSVSTSQLLRQNFLNRLKMQNKI
jgi:O-antigen/teichoic acid export membrane protein